MGRDSSPAAAAVLPADNSSDDSDCRHPPVHGEDAMDRQNDGSSAVPSLQPITALQLLRSASVPTSTGLPPSRSPRRQQQHPLLRRSTQLVQSLLTNSSAAASIASSFQLRSNPAVHSSIYEDDEDEEEAAAEAESERRTSISIQLIEKHNSCHDLASSRTHTAMSTQRTRSFPTLASHAHVSAPESSAIDNTSRYSVVSSSSSAAAESTTSASSTERQDDDALENTPLQHATAETDSRTDTTIDTYAHTSTDTDTDTNPEMVSLLSSLDPRNQHDNDNDKRSLTGIRMRSTGLRRTHRQQQTDDTHTDDDNNNNNSNSNNRRRHTIAIGRPSVKPTELPSAYSNDPVSAIEGPIIDVMDRIEDEVEAVAYEELVPLELQMALEDRVFGWTHLTSSILGHLIFTLGAYFVVYLAFDWVGMHLLPHRSVHINSHADNGQAHEERSVPTAWQALQIAVSLWAAITSYRMVRRRRNVWLRAAYGSKDYQTSAMRRRRSTLLRETDRTTVLGRTVSSFLERRIRKRLQRAEKQFAKKHARDQRERALMEQQLQQQERSVSFVGDDSDADDGSLTVAPTVASSVDTNDGHHMARHVPLKDDLVDTLTGAASAVVSDGSDETSPLLRRSLQSDNSDEDDDSRTTTSSSQHRRRKRRRRSSFHTDPTKSMQSIGHDQILFPTIQNMPYVHGAFFGAAPFLLANPHWISILRHLMPDVYVEISRRVAKVKAPRLIHWAENNPVVAAYGVANELEYHGHIPNLEWDVFLDPILVKRVQLVLDEQAKFKASIGVDDWSRPSSLSKLTEQQRNILAYYDQQLKRRSKNLVDKILIAHGKLTHLVLEQMGVLKSYNYSRVKRTRRTLGGGIYARQWMAVFAEALKLGLLMGDDLTVTDASEMASSSAASRKLRVTTSLMALAASTCPNMSIRQSVRMVQAIAKAGNHQPIGLVLDIKSRHVPKHIWSIVVETLRSWNVRVEGVASFYPQDIRGVSRMCKDPVNEIIFFHSAGDLQQACHEGRIMRNDKVYFNAGSLLCDQDQQTSLYERLACDFDPRTVQDSYRIQPLGKRRRRLSQIETNAPLQSSRENGGFGHSTLQDYQRHYNLTIGMYCQEFAIDDAAIRVLSEYVNDADNDIGLCWGGVNGITIKGIAPGRFTVTDGFWNQRYIGAAWDYDLYPTDDVEN